MTTGIARLRPDVGFADALAGADGTGEPVVPVLSTERFPDALAAPEADPAPLTLAPTPASSSQGPWPASPAAAGVRRAAQPGTQRQAAAGRRGQAAAAALGASPAVPVAPAAAPSAAFAYTPAAAAQRSAAPQAYLPAARPPAPPARAVPGQPARAMRAQPAMRRSAQPGARRSAQQPSVNYTATRPAPALNAKPKQTKKSGAGGFVAFLFFVLVALFATGLGRTILDALSNLINQWTR
jgi:hypothetical protein